MIEPSLGFPLVRQSLPGHLLLGAIRNLWQVPGAWPDGETCWLVGFKLPRQSPTQAWDLGLFCGRDAVSTT